MFFKLQSKMIALLLGALFANSVSATIIDNGNYTTDTTTGLDWLDVTETTGQSYDSVFSQLGSSGTYDGWRYASRVEVSDFYFNVSGISHAVGSISYDGETAYDSFINLLGDPIDYFAQHTYGTSYCVALPAQCIGGDFRRIWGITSDVLGSQQQYAVLISDDDRIDINGNNNPDFYHDGASVNIIRPEVNLTAGSFLVRDSLTTVPEPGILLLLLTGLFCILVRKRIHI